MINYTCTVCGFVYDEETAELDSNRNPIDFFELPAEWVCPNCGSTPDLFEETSTEEESDISLL